MEQKIRGLLAYLFGWIGGLVVLLAFKDNDSRTKFNACQSITMSGAACIVSIVLGFIPVIKYFASIFSVLMFVLAIVGMIKAYNEEDYELPVISDLTREIFKSKLD